MSTLFYLRYDVIDWLIELNTIKIKASIKYVTLNQNILTIFNEGKEKCLKTCQLSLILTKQCFKD